MLARMKFLFPLLLMMAIGSGCSWLWLGIDQPMEEPVPQEAVMVAGTVVRTIDDCAFDSICAYVVDTGAGEINVIWSEGRTIEPCQGFVEANIVVGDAIEAYGASSTRLDGESISICGDASYYVSLADQDTPQQEPTGAADVQNITGTVVEQISDCAFDGICAYVVETDAGQVNVIWSEGMTLQGCLGTIDAGIEIGDSIEATGATSMALEGASISVCGDASYYIHKA